MATQSRTPISDESNTGAFTTSPLFSKVNDSNDATLIVGVNNTGGHATFGFSAFTVPSNAAVSKLSIHYRARSTTTSSAATRGSSIKVGGTYYGLGDTTTNADPGGTPAISSASIGDYTYDYTINPQTGAAWTVADINGTGSNPLQAFGVCGNDFNPDVNFYQVDATVTYTIVYTLTGTTSSYSFTGNTATIQANRKVTATTGTNTFSGKTATLARGYTLTATSSNYSLSANSGSLLYNRKVIATSSPYTLTGNSASLTNNRRISATSNTFSFSGNNADLLSNRKLSATSSNYTLTPNTATLTYTTAGQYTLTATSATYSFNSGSASLLFNRLLQGQSTGYTFSASEAILNYTRVLTAVSAQYTLTGNNATLTWEGAQREVFSLSSAITDTITLETMMDNALELATEVRTQIILQTEIDENINLNTIIQT